jgi:hypothetical protein
MIDGSIFATIWSYPAALKCPYPRAAKERFGFDHGFPPGNPQQPIHAVGLCQAAVPKHDGTKPIFVIARLRRCFSKDLENLFAAPRSIEGGRLLNLS